MSTTRPNTRRDVLRGSLALAAGGMALGPLGMGRMSAMANATAQGGYKALVCVFLSGGIDGYDTLIPTTREGYGGYAGLRANLLARAEEAGTAELRARASLLPLASGGRDTSFGLPANMGALSDLYAEGNMAVIANMGVLAEPGTAQAALSGRVAIPPALMAHNYQADLWQSGMIGDRSSGWGGRMAEALGQQSPFAQLSIAGTPIFLTGSGSRSFELAPGGYVKAIRPLQDFTYGSSRFAKAMAGHLTASQEELGSLFGRDVARATRTAVQATADLSDVVKGAQVDPALDVESNPLAQQLLTVAKVIAARETIGVSRQVFFCKVGGYDTHGGQATKLPKLQAQLTEALSLFYRETERQGVADQVTTLTASDFGRTLRTNRNGTDHGWGNHHFVMGGAVAGGRMLGQMVPTALGHAQDYGGGRLMPTTSIEQLGGSLGRWFGLSESDLSGVFPGYGRFDQGALPLFG